MTAAYLSASTMVTREFHDHEGFACYLMQILRDHGLIIDLSCPNDVHAARVISHLAQASGR
jgi:hypothetical protein